MRALKKGDRVQFSAEWLDMLGNPKRPTGRQKIPPGQFRGVIIGTPDGYLRVKFDHLKGAQTYAAKFLAPEVHA